MRATSRGSAWWVLPCFAVALSVSGRHECAADALDFELAAVSRYIWRGFDLSQGADFDDHVNLQPSLTYSHESGLSVNLWASYAFDGSLGLDEVDYLVDYTFSPRDDVDVSLGYWRYTFPSVPPGTPDSTYELYVGAAWPAVRFSPSLFLYYDFDVGDDYYVELGLSHDFAVSDNLTLNGGLALGYNGGQYATDSGLSNLALSLSTDVPLNEQWSLTPSLSYVFTDHHGPAPVNSENEFIVGLTLATSMDLGD